MRKPNPNPNPAPNPNPSRRHPTRAGDSSRSSRCDTPRLDPHSYPKPNANLSQVELDRTLTLMMLDWTTHKDITRIAQWVDPHMLGSFVKAVMRVASYLDVTKEVLLGLGMYEAYNSVDNHMALLLGGLVTNESLYLRIADE